MTHTTTSILKYPMPHWFTDKKLLTLTAFMLLSVLGSILAINQLIQYTTKDYLYSTPEQLPFNKVGVVLGTSNFTSEGVPNGHYFRRLEATAELVKAGRIQYVLVSGDNATPWYDEPTRMKQGLIRLGVPADIIYRDDSGFRTLDSVLRAKDVFGQQSFTIISQQYQNERAVYIARQHDIDAIAFNAHGELVHYDYSNRLRELLARVLAFLETSILDTGPQVLGPAIHIGESPQS